MKLYHYTTGDRLEMILKTGFLLPTNEFKDNPSPSRKRIKAPVWLSKNEVLEPAVIKPVMTSGGKRMKLSVEQFHEHFSIHRIEIKPTGKTISFDRLVRVMGLPSEESKVMVEAAKSDGCNPSDWYGFIGKIKVKDFVSVEKYIAGKWVKIS